MVRPAGFERSRNSAGPHPRRVSWMGALVTMGKVAARIGTTAVVLIAWAVLPMRAAQDGIPNSFLWSSGIAGQLESGMLVEDVYRLLGPQNVAIESTFPEGMFQPVLRITLPGSSARPAIIAEIDRRPSGDCAVTRMRVFDPRFASQVIVPA